MSRDTRKKKLADLLAGVNALKEQLDALRPLTGREILQALDTEYTYDGNGRTARLIMNLALLQLGYPSPIFQGKARVGQPTMMRL